MLITKLIKSTLIIDLGTEKKIDPSFIHVTLCHRAFSSKTAFTRKLSRINNFMDGDRPLS